MSLFLGAPEVVGSPRNVASRCALLQEVRGESRVILVGLPLCVNNSMSAEHPCHHPTLGLGPTRGYKAL